MRDPGRKESRSERAGSCVACAYVVQRVLYCHDIWAHQHASLPTGRLRTRLTGISDRSSRNTVAGMMVTPVSTDASVAPGHWHVSRGR